MKTFPAFWGYSVPHNQLVMVTYTFNLGITEVHQNTQLLSAPSLNPLALSSPSP